MKRGREGGRGRERQQHDYRFDDSSFPRLFQAFNKKTGKGGSGAGSKKGSVKMSMEEKDEDAALMKTATSTTRSGGGKEEREGKGGKRRNSRQWKRQRDYFPCERRALRDSRPPCVSIFLSFHLQRDPPPRAAQGDRQRDHASLPIGRAQLDDQTPRQWHQRDPR